MDRKALAGIAALVMVAGTGACTSSTSPLEENLSYVPVEAAFYLDVYIDPGDDQKAAIDDLLAKFPEEAGTFDKGKQSLIDVLDPELEKIGLSYEVDIQPWAGDQAALFILPPEDSDEPSGAVLIKTTDEEASEGSLEDGFEGADLPEPSEPIDHAGESYRTIDVGEESPVAYSVAGGYVIVGDEVGVKAALGAADGDSLEDSEAFERATAELPEDRLFTFFIDGERFFEAIKDAPDLTPEDEEGLQAMEELGGLASSAISLTVDDGAVYFDSVSDVSQGGIYTDLLANLGDESPLGDLPGGSWFAFGFPEVGETVTTVLESFSQIDATGFDLAQVEASFRAETGLDLQDDLLSWMGDAAFFVQGANLQDVGGGLVLESSDAGKAEAALVKLREVIDSEEPGFTQDIESEAGTGFSIQAPGQPAPIRMVAGDRVIIAYGDAAFDSAVSRENTLADSEAYGGAIDILGGDYTPLFYADIQKIRIFAEAALAFGGQAQNPTYTEDVRPWLEPLTYAVAGARTDDETVVQRFVIGTE